MTIILPRRHLPHGRCRQYPENMEIPLSLKKSADGRLIYGIPLWYRIATAAMLLLVAGGVFTSGGSPSLIAWIILVLLLLGLVYEERWVIEPRMKRVRHFSGIWPIAHVTLIGFDDIEEFRLGAFARGTIPGSAEEAADKERAFAMLKGKDKEEMGRPNIFKSGRRKPYITLLLKTKEGEDYLVDSLPARSARRLMSAGEAMAATTGSRFKAQGS